MELPNEILVYVISVISDSKTYYQLALSSRRLSKICLDLKPRMAKKYCLKVDVSYGYGTSTYNILPNGKYHGIQEIYHHRPSVFFDGIVVEKIPWEYGHRDGHTESYDFRGNIISIVPYIKNNKHGQEIHYFYLDNVQHVLKTIEWCNNEKHGKEVVFYYNGTTKSICTWHHNEKHGNETIYESPTLNYYQKYEWNKGILTKINGEHCHYGMFHTKNKRQSEKIQTIKSSLK